MIFSHSDKVFWLKHFLPFFSLIKSIFLQMVEFFHRAIGIASEVKQKTSKLKDYKEYLENNDEVKTKMDALKSEVNKFALQFPMPGFEEH